MLITCFGQAFAYNTLACPSDVVICQNCTPPPPIGTNIWQCHGLYYLRTKVQLNSGMYASFFLLGKWHHIWGQICTRAFQGHQGRPVCFVFEMAGAPRHYLIGRGHHAYEDRFLLEHFKGTKAGPYASSLRGQGYQGIFSLVEGTIWGQISTTRAFQGHQWRHVCSSF